MARRSSTCRVGLRIGSLVITLIAATLVPRPVHAQVCEGDLQLFTQADVNAFICSEVTGDLSIGDWPWATDITNLGGLSELTSVGGSLAIFGNPRLTNVSGLSSLTSVGGALGISDNPVLTNVDGWSSLTSVGGNVIVQRNPVLINVDGLSAVTSVGGDVNVAYNPVLMNVDGLSGLTSVGGDLRFFENAGLTNLNGLASLTSVGRHLGIARNFALTNLDGLSGVTSVGGDMWIGSDNDALAECCGVYPLLSVNGVAGTITIENNTVGCNSVQDILDGGPCPNTAVKETTWGDIKVTYRK